MRLLIIAALSGALPIFAMAETPAQTRAEVGKLLDLLKNAPSEEAAAPLEQHIRELWAHAGTPAVTLLMTRALREMHADDLAGAIEDFGDAIVLDPNQPEAYRMRAVARYQSGDTPGAIADLQAAVQHEPRDFAAYETLSHIAEDSEDWKGAYAAWQKVLEIDPKIEDGTQRLKELQRKAFGEET